MESNKFTYSELGSLIMGKIFGIGLSRTGSLSLTAAFKYLNYNFLHNPHYSILFKGNYDGACDSSVVRFYKELDKKFPNSKFIYTIREKEKWIASVDKHFNRVAPEDCGEEMLEDRMAIYGQIKFDKDIFLNKYIQHDKDIKLYFNDRPKDLLIINICNGEGWEKLLPFVDRKNIPQITFPHKHKSI